MTKKKWLSFSILLVVVIMVVLVFIIKPNQNTFTLELEVDKMEYNVGDTINIKAKLKNKSIGYYKTTFLYTEINVMVYLEGTSVYLPQPMSYSRILPLSTISRNLYTKESEPGKYIIKAYSKFTIRGEEFILEKQFQ